MIRIQLEGREQELSYEEFIRAIQEGRVSAETPVYSEVLTSRSWKAAGQLQLFRVWAPKGSLPPEEEPPLAKEPISEPPEEAESPTPPPAAPDSSPEEEMPEEPGPIPWEMMDRLGFAAAFLWTVSLAFRAVDEFFERIRRGNLIIPALTFGLLIFTVASVFKALYDALIFSRFGPMVEEFYRSFPGMTGEEFTATGPRDVFLLYGFQILVYPAFAFLWSAVIQLLLRLFGKDWSGFNLTFRVLNYAMAPLLLTIFPGCGNIVGAIWAIVLTVRGIARVHRIEAFQAAMAVLVPIVVVFCVYFAVVFFSMMPMMSSLGEGLPS